MPVKEEAESDDSSSSSGDSSSNSSSSSSSSSDSDSSDSGSSSSSPNKSPGRPTPTSTSVNDSKKPGPGSKSSKRSCSSRSSSVSSISSAKSKSSKQGKKSPSGSSSTTKKVTSTTPAASTSRAAVKNEDTNKGSRQKGAVVSSSKKVTAASKADKGNSNEVSSTSKNGPVKKGDDDAKRHKAASSASSSRSKVVKSGTVTNAHTIKPLHTNMKSKTAGKAGSSKGRDVAVKGGGHKDKKPVVPPAEHSKKGSPSVKREKQNDVKKLEAIESQGVRTRASSCSSAASTSSSSADSSSSEIEDSSVTESSPAQKKKLSGIVANKTKVLTAKKSGPGKKSVKRNLSKEMISSADDDSTGAEQAEEKPKKKQPHQRRPVTRRQKSGVKKTIPTTTLFSQSLLLSAGGGSPTSSPRKPPASAAAASSSSDVPVPASAGRFASSIVNRRSTTNSSAASSENESMDGSSIRKRFPFSSVTASSSIRNKYLSTWDSDFSDDNFSHHFNNSAANFIRVPAKTSNRPRPLDGLQSGLDCDMEMSICPFPSCDSSGHLSGKYPSHNFLSCCPRYHGFEPPECVENEQERSRRESERTRFRNILSTPGKKPPKQTTETRAWLSAMKEYKERQVYEGLVSEYDAVLWKDGLAIAAERVEKEQNEGQGVNCRMAVAMGRFEMKCWCSSPYPDPLSQNRRLFVCEFCLKPVGSGTVLRRHCAKCVWRHPPGDEIYRKDRLSVWEVDGKKQKTYCQNLCLLAKCFLDHKTLYLDVDPFLFYVMTLADSQGCHLVGYFSKEKNSFLNYNVSCILTLPPYMRQGFGRLLIDFSYLLTRVEGKIGSPEKPLSDLGLISYRSYWKDAVLRRLCACASREINIKDLSIELGVSTADLISTLQFLGMLKYWKGKHLVLKKQDVLEDYLERVRRRGNERQIDSSCLRWRPYQPPPEDNSSSEKC